VFGAVTDGGRQFFRTATRGFNNVTFMPYVRAHLRRFKNGAAIGQGADAPLDAGEEGIWQKQKRRVHLPARGPAVPQRLGAMLARGKTIC